MKTNVCLTATLRQPFRAFLLLILFGLITFGFMTKAVEFILVQRETEVFGSYYRSIGFLENIKDPQSRDISAGIDLIETSPYLAYGDQREIVSGVIPQTYNRNSYISNCTGCMERYPKEEWANVHTTDVWFIGELIEKVELKRPPEDGDTVAYYLKFDIDTVLAAYPEYMVEGWEVGIIFGFKGHESVIPLIDEMEIGQRYFMRGWEDVTGEYIDFSWGYEHYTVLEIKPLDDGALWYIPLDQEESIDFSDPAMLPFKQQIDVLNENMHTLGIITTTDMSAIPRMQEASQFFYLTAGRWLNHQDDLDGNKVIVVPEAFAKLRHLQLGDELRFTFRPLTDAYYGMIRDGVDALNWRNYPTYQDTFTIVGLYAQTGSYNVTYYAYMPTSTLQSGFTSAAQDQFRWAADYSFVLDSSRNESEFVQAYKEPLKELGIGLTILENNGPSYWAAVDPMRRSLAADLLVFGLLLIVALILAVFLYQMQRKRDYAILRALGIPVGQANAQFILPLLLLGEIGIMVGGFTAWHYALNQVRATLSTIPTPAGVHPSVALSLNYLVGLCAGTFVLLALFSSLGVFFLARRPILALLQGNTAQPGGRQKRSKAHAVNQARPVNIGQELKSVPERALVSVKLVSERKYNPLSLRRYVRHQVLRSRLKSLLTLAIALGFVLAAGWIRQTMERGRLDVDHLYDTIVVEADLMKAGTSSGITQENAMKGIVYRKSIHDILDNEFVESSVLAASAGWLKIERLESQEKVTGNFPVYAFDSPEAFYSGLANPGSLIFAPEWDMNRFAKPRTLAEIKNEDVPALFPTSLLEELQINVGERVKISNGSGTYTSIVVGEYEGWLVTINNSIKTQWRNSGGHYILIPLSVLESMEGSQTRYATAHFILDPAKNRELPQFRAEMEEVVSIYNGSVQFVIWDEELRVVIDQLEKNISLLEVLYPVVIGVSVLVGGGLCFLLLLQTAREAAILRVLGTTRTAVRLALISVPFGLSIIGVAISLGIALFLWMTSDLVSVGSLLTSAGLYLAGALVGSVSGAIMVTHKMPLELLQVKE